MNYYIIGFGLGGGFGGIKNYEVVEVQSEEQALDWAQESAKEEYQQYEGMYGLESIDTIMEEDEELSLDDAEIAYNEAVDSWIEFSAEPYSKELEEKYQDHHYDNRYEEETKELK